MTEEDALDEDEQPIENNKQSRKKLMILLLPLLIVIGVSVGVYFTLTNKRDSTLLNYPTIQNKDSSDGMTIFYDLPEVKTSVKGTDGRHELRLKVNLELSSTEDLKTIEILTPRLTDAILNHTVELTFEEIDGSAGLYWLKEELLYRFNLSVAPVKIKGLNFNVFELQR
jgi:flagellar FliL protein